ncbi:cytotoxic T-lymphocyte protein 4 isoform X2 [Rhineura floridana]|uniref:cytotoxic T-lymphocyte protein 4 isoform X2 n=1 Tax=Rhineura floridana TaxID=261503 RepID=UPI002AC81FD5|nr:cytotoxic T-lymphocyte protein 4 isoform X2 [Rhineura floridana]
MISFLFAVVFFSTAADFRKVIEVTQPAFLVVKRQEAAHFLCEYKNAGDAAKLAITLLKQLGNESIKICASSFTTKYEPFITMGDIQCQVHPGRKSVNVTLWGLRSTDAGLYICKIEQIYPPPYYPVKGRGTQLYVIDTDPCPDTHLYLWIIVTVASGLLGYSILITIYIMRKVIQKSSYLTPGVYEKIMPM